MTTEKQPMLHLRTRGRDTTKYLIKDWNTWPCGNLWPHFKPWEFRSRDGDTDLILHTELLDGLEEMRKRCGHALHINSGYRSISWNKIKGGVTGSYHTLGMAADIAAANNVEFMGTSATSVEYFRNGGVGLYPVRGFVHVDIRPDGPARWRK